MNKIINANLTESRFYDNFLFLLVERALAAACGTYTFLGRFYCLNTLAGVKKDENIESTEQMVDLINVVLLTELISWNCQTLGGSGKIVEDARSSFHHQFLEYFQLFTHFFICFHMCHMAEILRFAFSRS